MKKRNDRSGSRSRGIFDDLPRLADLAKRIYTLERRLHESALLGQPSSYLPQDEKRRRAVSLELAAPCRDPWMNIAQFLAKRQIGPVDYIVRQFDQYASLTMPLYPNHLLGEAAWKRYEDSKAAKRQELVDWLRRSRLRMRNSSWSSVVVWPENRRGRDQEVEGYLSVLYCDRDLAPLFVHCAAMHLAQTYPAYSDGTAKLLQESELEAAVEYVRFRCDYKSAWGTMIPKVFPDRATIIYRNVLSEIM